MLGALDRVRALFAWKCGGLDAAGLAARLGPSTMTLGGLLKHMALVEDHHFAKLLLGRPPGPPWDGVDWDAEPDWEWTSAAADPPEGLLALWTAAVERSRVVTAAALAEGGMDHLGAHVARSGQSPNMRRILLDLVEEYARHLGHADLLREAVDGLVGEDPED